MRDAPERLRAALTDTYRIGRALGSGGMATVYLAEDVKHGREVAVKVLHPELAAAIGSERFVREIAIAAKLTHPHILMLINSGEAEGFLYYVMPYVDGESLRDRLERDKKLSIAETVRITEQVASALSYAHDRGVIHRDIKPENILLAGDQAIVADFGIARAVEMAGSERLTGTGLAIGTPAYMSPEQAFGQANVDGRSDVYALGCVVYEMVSGRTPFDGATPQAMLAQQAMNTAPSLRTHDPSVPVYVERAVSRAMAKEPGQRFNSPTAFADTLTSETVVAQVGSKRLAITSEEELAIPDKPSIAVLAFENLSGDPEQEYFGDGIAEDIITDLSRISGLFVIARNSSFSYKGRNVPVGQIGREMGVRFVLEGSVRKAGARVRIAAQLVETSTEGHVWAKRFDRNLEDVFAVQDEITEEVVTALDVKLVAGEQARIWRKSLKNPEARELYYQARESFQHATKESQVQARELFARVIAEEPDSPLGYAGAAWSHWYDAFRGWSASPAQSMARAEELVQSALARDENNPDAHTILAAIYSQKREYEQAISEAERAIALGPNMADNLVLVGMVFNFSDRLEEAHALIRRAIRLCPVYPGYYLALLGHTFSLRGRYEEAIEPYQQAAAQEPDYPTSHFGLAVAYGALGRKKEAHAAAETFRRVAPHVASLQEYARRHPFKDPGALDGWLDALRKAGLPE